jgi:ParB-like chromosome segregation protein Spo0J
MRRAVTIAEVVNVPIADIEVGPRRRQSLGQLDRLARAIEAHGLLHPILLRGTRLIAGERRLRACERLGWKSIPAKQVQERSLTDEDLRAIEVIENTARENLTDYATSKQRLAEIRQAEADLKAKAARDLSSKSDEKSSTKRKRGRPKKSNARSAVAAETGVSKTEQQRVERHVELAERYPFMQRGGWLRHHVLDAGDQLEQLPEAQRSPIAALLDQDGIPPKDAIRYLHNAATFSNAAREQMIQLSRSDDEHERGTALTNIANVPPPVDPGLTLLTDAEKKLRDASRECRHAEFQPRIATLANEASELLGSFKEANRHDRKERQLVSVAATDRTARGAAGSV